MISFVLSVVFSFVSLFIRVFIRACILLCFRLFVIMFTGAVLCACAFVFHSSSRSVISFLQRICLLCQTEVESEKHVIPSSLYYIYMKTWDENLIKAFSISSDFL